MPGKGQLPVRASSGTAAAISGLINFDIANPRENCTENRAFITFFTKRKRFCYHFFGLESAFAQIAPVGFFAIIFSHRPPRRRGSGGLPMGI